VNRQDRDRRDAIARTLQTQLGDERWSVDELRVVQSIVDGLILGRDVYGPLELGTDKRYFTIEAKQEARDLAVYRACQMLVEQDRELEVERERPRHRVATIPPKLGGEGRGSGGVVDLTFDLTDLPDTEAK